MRELEIQGDLYRAKRGALIFVGEGVTLELLANPMVNKVNYKLEDNVVIPDLNEIRIEILVERKADNKIEEDVILKLVEDGRSKKYVKGKFEALPAYLNYYLIDDDQKVCEVEGVIDAKGKRYNIKNPYTNKVRNTDLTHEELKTQIDENYTPICEIKNQ